jgi:hypothetical protein
VSVRTAAGAFSKLQQSSLNEPESKEVSVPTAAGAISKLQQSSLNEPENKGVSFPTGAGAFSKQQQSALNEPENKEVSVPTAVGALRKLEQSSMYDLENREGSVTTAAGALSKLGKLYVPSAASVVRTPSIIHSLKSFFGVRKEISEIKITVTPEEFLKKSWKVGKKKLHQRKIVPVII